MSSLKKFSAQASEELLVGLKSIAKKEGRKLHHVIDDAFKDYIEKKESGKVRPKILKSLNKSKLEFNELYTKLAK